MRASRRENEGFRLLRDLLCVSSSSGDGGGNGSRRQVRETQGPEDDEGEKFTRISRLQPWRFGHFLRNITGKRKKVEGQENWGLFGSFGKCLQVYALFGSESEFCAYATHVGKEEFGEQNSSELLPRVRWSYRPRGFPTNDFGVNDKVKLR